MHPNKTQEKAKKDSELDPFFLFQEQPFLHLGTNESGTGGGNKSHGVLPGGTTPSAFVFSSRFSFQSISQQGPKATRTKEMEQILELSPLILQGIGCFSVEMMVPVGRRI